MAVNLEQELKEAKRQIAQLVKQIDELNKECAELQCRNTRLSYGVKSIAHTATDLQDVEKQRGPSYPVDKAAREFHPERYRG